MSRSTESKGPEKTFGFDTLNGRGDRDGRYALAEILPAADTFVAICEASDFAAEEIRNTSTVTGVKEPHFHSHVLLPETPQATVLTDRERTARVQMAKLTQIISKNDVGVKEAWGRSSGFGTVDNLKSVLSQAGIQVSDSDAVMLSKTVGSGKSKIGFDELFQNLNINNNIA